MGLASIDKTREDNQANVKEKIKLIMRLIQIFDDLSVLRRTSIDDIDHLVKDIGDRKVRSIWAKYRRDAERIIDFPYTVPGVINMIRLKEVLRMIIPISMIYVLIVIGVIIHPSFFKNFKNIVNPLLLLVALIISTAAGVSIVLLDYLIRRKISNIETEYSYKLKPFQNRMKQAAQELITYLNQLLRREARHEKIKCVIDLWHNDYRDAVLVGSRQHKILFFKTRFKVYTYEIKQ